MGSEMCIRDSSRVYACEPTVKAELPTLSRLTDIATTVLWLAPVPITRCPDESALTSCDPIVAALPPKFKVAVVWPFPMTTAEVPARLGVNSCEPMLTGDSLPTAPLCDECQGDSPDSAGSDGGFSPIWLPEELWEPEPGSFAPAAWLPVAPGSPEPLPCVTAPVRVPAPAAVAADPGGPPELWLLVASC